MNSFKITRVATLLRKEFYENRKSLILRAVLIIGSMIIINLLISTIHNNVYLENSTPGKDPAQSGIITFYVIAAYFASALSASFLFENMATKAQRLSTLMLPASNAEKFASRFIIYIAGFFLLFAASCAVAEIFRIAVFSCVYPDSTCLLPVTHLDFPSRYGSQFWKAIGAFVGIFIFLQSLFALGSILWPKNSFIKTFGALWVLQMLFSLTMSFFSVLLFDSDSHYVPDNDILVIIMYAFLYLGTIANWIIVYLRFKESEIIHRM